MSDRRRPKTEVYDKKTCNMAENTNGGGIKTQYRKKLHQKSVRDDEPDPRH